MLREPRHFRILEEEKEHIVEKKIDVILPLQCEFASSKAEGSLNANEYTGVEKVVDGGEALRIGEDNDLGDAATNGGNIGKGDVYVLIDNGSTYNFIRHDVVEKLCLPTHFMKVFKVYIGGGETLLCENMCAHVAIEIQGLRMKVDFGIKRPIGQTKFDSWASGGVVEIQSISARLLNFLHAALPPENEEKDLEQLI
nr:hypothetical protein [Tanacetum cinerariifolium]